MVTTERGFLDVQDVQDFFGDELKNMNGAVVVRTTPS